MSDRFREPWPVYALAAVTTAAAALGGNALAARLDLQLAPTLLMVVIVACSWLGGAGPGLLATALAAVHLLIGPVAWLRNGAPGGRSDLLLLVVGGMLVSGLGEALRRARRHPFARDDAVADADAPDSVREVELRLDLGARGEVVSRVVAGALHHLLGYEDDDDVTAADAWRVLLHPDDRPVAESLLRGALGGATGDAVLRYVGKTGAVQRLALHLQPTLDRWGEVTSVRVRLRPEPVAEASVTLAGGEQAVLDGLSSLREAVARGASWHELEPMLLGVVRDATHAASAGVALRGAAHDPGTLAAMVAGLVGDGGPARLTAAELEVHPSLAVSEFRTAGGALPSGLVAVALRDGGPAPLGWLWVADSTLAEFAPSADRLLELVAGIVALLLSREALADRLITTDRREEQLRASLSQARARVEGRSAQIVRRIDQLLASVGGAESTPAPRAVRREPSEDLAEPVGG